MVAHARHAVLTGAPGAGKTTLLEAAAAAGMHVSHEVARAVLRAPGGMELRAHDPLGFADAMLAAHLAEIEGAAGREPVVFDRGLPDVVGFLEVSGLPVSSAIDAACRMVCYDGPVLRAPAWQEIYRPDDQRIQTFDEAVASDAAVTAAWQRYGYEVIDLPLAPLGDRLAFLKQAMALQHGSA
jgi:predicted ATPase